MKNLILIAYVLFQMTPVNAGDSRISPDLSKGDHNYLKRIQSATFHGFDKLIDPVTGFPIDIVSIQSGEVTKDYGNIYRSKTSPTNIALGFLFLVAARDLNFYPQTECLKRVHLMMDTLLKLEVYQGFVFNWYTLSGRANEVPVVSLNRYVSSVDNGNLDASLMIADSAFNDPELSKKIESYLSKKNYMFFFNKNPYGQPLGLLNLGYDESKKAYSGSDYGILNVESRVTAFLAVLKDNVPDSAWKNQSRNVKSYKDLTGQEVRVVESWGGSLFETLFADEILGGDKLAPKAFRRNAINTIHIHKDMGRKLWASGIWGFSNGEVPKTGRYEMAGVPATGSSTQSCNFVTLYSAFLALRYDPRGVLENLLAIEKLNPKSFSLKFGFTDSIDPMTSQINDNVLGLDKGIEVVSIFNFLQSLNNKKMLSDYLWEYLGKKGWKMKGEHLIKEEENNSSFLNVSILSIK